MLDALGGSACSIRLNRLVCLEDNTLLNSNSCIQSLAQPHAEELGNRLCLGHNIHFNMTTLNSWFIKKCDYIIDETLN